MNPLLRPVQKQISRLFLAGTNNAVGANAAVDCHNHDSTTFSPPAALSSPTPVAEDVHSTHSFPVQFGLVQSTNTAWPCLWQQPSSQWQPWIQSSALAGEHVQESMQAGLLPEGEAVEHKMSAETSCSPPSVIAAAVPVLPAMQILCSGWPSGAVMMPVVMSMGSTAFPVVGDAGTVGLPQHSQQQASDKLASSASGPTRTGASRRRRRKQFELSLEEAAPVAQPVLAESMEQVKSPSARSEIAESDVGGPFWPATPESTPPSSPRELFAGIESSAAPLGVLLQDTTELAAQSVVLTSGWALASTQEGSRLVQKFLEEAGHLERAALVDQLRGHVREAVASPHANHVLQKCIEVMPPERLGFIFEELQGHVVTIAKHRYGCRVLERLIEHCPSKQTVGLIEEVLRAAPQLCRHTFGNFVVQHILEHGMPDQKERLVDILSGDALRLGRHRFASHVMRCALVNCTTENKKRLGLALTAEPSEFADLSRHHWGSFVIRELRHQLHGQPDIGLWANTPALDAN